MKVEDKQIYLNPPQYKFEMVQANINVLIWGRRTGKTNYPMARFITNNVMKMPGSNGWIVANTYEQMLTRTLPPLLEGLQRLGWYENVHFWVRKFAPRNLLIPKSVRAPLKADHYIQFLNGSGIFLVSQDVVASINGVAAQYGAGDEAKFLNKEKLDNEVMLTLSGMPEFSHLSNYLSLFFSTDMPRDVKGKWLFQFQQLMNDEVIDLIIQLQTEVHKKTLQLKSVANKSLLLKGYREINEMEHALNKLRKTAVYYSEASTLDNVHVLGLEPLKQFKRTLSQLDFEATVLNKRSRGSGLGFYSLLHFDNHGYEAPNYHFIESIPLIYNRPPAKDCRWDADVLPNIPLDIGCDYNAAINCIVTGQYNKHTNEIKFLSSKYVLNPNKIEQLALEWHEYYKFHPVKDVNYYYDVTAEWEKADDSLPYADTWYNALSKLGWNVNMISVGAVPSYNKRYLEWNKLLSEFEKEFPKFKFNKQNAYDWYVSASEADAKDTIKGIEKNKQNEKNKEFPQQEATHLSDAGDILLWGMLRDIAVGSEVFMDFL